MTSNCIFCGRVVSAHAQDFMLKIHGEVSSNNMPEGLAKATASAISEQSDQIPRSRLDQLSLRKAPAVTLAEGARAESAG
jgi:hypothetical protein